MNLDFCTITNTQYTHNKVDWHYHENAYFTFIIAGAVLESNKKETHHCTAGTLLFHNWQDPHYNIKPPGHTRGFHIEVKQEWFNECDLKHSNMEGSFKIEDPEIKIPFHHLYRETRMLGPDTDTFIQSLLLEVLTKLQGNSRKYNQPNWVPKLKEILHDRWNEKLTLDYLSKELNIHPVHLSRDFPRHFHCTLGEYMRKLRIEKAMSLLADEDRSLTDIALECGFADQSHFIRCFKVFNKVRPSLYRDSISW